MKRAPGTTAVSKCRTALGHPALLVAVFMLVGLLVRVFVLQQRWINPDEGSYLMDARLILDGGIPVVDYAARQPFFLYLLAGALKVFSVDLVVGRCLVLAASLGIALLLYKIADTIFSREVGLLACAAFLFMPFTMIWSVSVMTEIPATLLACVCLYALIRADGDNDRMGYFILSGVAAGLAFYVRQTAIWIPAVVVLYLCCLRKKGGRRALRGLFFFIAGYLLVCAAAVAFYLQHMPLREIFFSRLNPQEIILSKIMVSAYTAWSGVTLLTEPAQSAELTGHYLCEIVTYALPLLVGAGMALYYAAKQKSRTIVLLALWFCVVFIMYALRTLERGVYAHYLIELLPPLLLLFAFGVRQFFGSLSGAANPGASSRALPLAGFLGLYLAIYALQHAFWESYPGALVYLGGSLLLCLLVAGPWKGGFGKRSVGNFLLLLILTFSLYYSAGRAGVRLGANYDSVWSLETLEEATAYLERYDNAEVLAGCTIWAFQSGLKPAQMVSHPLAFQTTTPEMFRERFENRAPEIIILDGYTEKNISSHMDYIRAQLRERYREKITINGSKFPVIIYELHEERIL